MTCVTDREECARKYTLRRQVSRSKNKASFFTGRFVGIVLWGQLEKCICRREEGVAGGEHSLRNRAPHRGAGGPVAPRRASASSLLAPQGGGRASPRRERRRAPRRAPPESPRAAPPPRRRAPGHSPWSRS